MRAAPLVALALALAWLPGAGRAQPAADAEAAAGAEAGEDAQADEPGEAQTAGKAPSQADKQAEADPKAQLAAMLERVRARAAREAEEDRAREAEFQRALDEQQRLLEETNALVAREEAASLALDERYGANELEIEDLGIRLTERLGQMGELFGVVRLVATDLGAETWDSLTSAGVEPRNDVLERLGRSKDLPSTQDMQALWFELQREMTRQGQVERVRAPVRLADEQVEERDVIRAGPFVAISGGEYLAWQAPEQMLRRLDRPPPAEYAATARRFGNGSGGGFQRLAVDPSRGVLLEALTDTPNVWERVQQGGYVGYTTIVLGALALLIGLVRLADLWRTQRRVDVQLGSERLTADNPVGRLRAVYETNRKLDTEALELKLDDAILRESSRLERLLWVVQTVSIVAPLLGLLGTVTGMIQTFQAITLFGAGDPKVMAKGISEALVTTMLGLVIAIPLVLLYALLATRSRSLVESLEETSSALIAESLEQDREATP